MKMGNRRVSLSGVSTYRLMAEIERRTGKLRLKRMQCLECGKSLKGKRHYRNYPSLCDECARLRMKKISAEKMC